MLKTNTTKCQRDRVAGQSESIFAVFAQIGVQACTVNYFLDVSYRGTQGVPRYPFLTSLSHDLDPIRLSTLCLVGPMLMRV